MILSTPALAGNASRLAVIRIFAQCYSL